MASECMHEKQYAARNAPKFIAWYGLKPSTGLASEFLVMLVLHALRQSLGTHTLAALVSGATSCCNMLELM